MSKNAKKDTPKSSFVAHQKPIELWELNRVKPYEKNPRRIPQKAIEKVAASIQRFGWQWPILVDAKGVIVAGHTRYAAAKHLGHESVPVAVFTGDAKAAREFRIADNRVAQETAFDLDVLAEELQALIAEDTNLASLVFDDAEISRLIGGIPGLADEDEAPAPPAEPVTKRGDLWLLGDHRLLCGDSTDLLQVQRLMDAFEADLLLTDPPYNVDYEGSDGKKIKNDKMGDAQFRQFLRDAFASAFAVMRPGAAFYIWYSDVETANFSSAVVEIFGKLRQVLIWKKDSLIMGRKDYHWMHEPCLYGWKDGAPHLWMNDRKQTSVIEHPKPQKNDDHPTMKPVGLIEYQMKNNTHAGDIVLDLFLVSGSTLIAAEKSARRCFGMELDPRYCDVAVQRWQAFTGQQARLESTGEPFCNS